MAKQLGLSTVLGQIDAGPFAEEIYDQAYVEIGSIEQRRSRRPPAYWESWRKECEMADMIVVNSEWSKRALEWANIRSNKITVIPVAFDVKGFGVRDSSYDSIVPARFSPEEPLKIVFVGSISVEKGIHHLLKAANELKGEPVQFQIVGSGDLSRRLRATAPDNVQFVGPVPRCMVKAHMERAHLLLFPSLSDGFGIVQLEAHASGLPVLASANCGQVVIDGQTGLILTELTPAAICNAIRQIISYPKSLIAMSRRASIRVLEFSVERVGSVLMQKIRQIQSTARP
jgi:glycosyltransferase involved in cell wall biosynthesis